MLKGCVIYSSAYLIIFANFVWGMLCWRSSGNLTFLSTHNLCKRDMHAHVQHPHLMMTRSNSTIYKGSC